MDGANNYVLTLIDFSLEGFHSIPLNVLQDVAVLHGSEGKLLDLSDLNRDSIFLT